VAAVFRLCSSVPQKLLTANAGSNAGKKIEKKRKPNPTKPKPKLNALAAWLSLLDQASVASGWWPVVQRMLC